MLVLTIFAFLVGLGILIFGAEILVRGASSLAARFGISPIVIGLTIVAFGTSAPELVVNLYSAFRGTADIAIGNIVGSNIFNILAILGVAAMIRPLKILGNTVWKEIPFALLAMVLVFTMGNDRLFDGSSFNAVTRTDGFSLISMFAVFIFYVFGLAKAEGRAEKTPSYPLAVSSVMTVAGPLVLFAGGKIVVDSAVIMAATAGISEALIGLTIIAAGTSLPELATSIVAAIHRADDIAVGNIVGSNIFNVFWILGITSTILPLPFNSHINVDVLVAGAATALLFLSMFLGRRRRLDRWQGAVFLGLYLIYLAYLIARG